MPKKSTFLQRFLPLIIGVLILIISFLGVALTTKESPLVFLSSESRTPGEFYIDPEELTMQVGDSYTFEALFAEGATSSSTLSDWSVLRDDEEATDIQLEDCENSSTCTVYAGDVLGDVILSASMGDLVASATLDVIGVSAVDLGFTDEVPEWASTYIAILNGRGIMMGYEDGSFGADDLVTRAQYVTLLYRIMPIYGLDPDVALQDRDCDVFLDLTSSHFAYEPACLAHYYGWLDNLDLGSSLNPNLEITRAEAAELFAGAMGRTRLDNVLRSYGFPYSADEIGIAFTNEYLDVNSETLYQSGIGIAQVSAIMRGDETYFRPEESLNRAETATLIWRILFLMASGDDELESRITEEELRAAGFDL